MEKNCEGRIWSISKKTMFPLTMDDVYLLLITLIDRNLSGVLDKILVTTNCLGTDKNTCGPYQGFLMVIYI